MSSQTRLVLSAIGTVLFVVSLFLPALPGNSGFVCLVLAWPFYVPNLALVVAPFVCWSRALPPARWITAGILLSSFAATLILGVRAHGECLIGYWLWCAAFAFSGTAATLPNPATESPPNLRWSWGAGIALLVLVAFLICLSILVGRMAGPMRIQE
jgi:hypothetical protein